MRTNPFAQKKPLSDFFDAVVSAPFGAVGICLSFDKKSLFGLTYLTIDFSKKRGDTPLAQEVATQVAAYLIDASYQFDLPTIRQGTGFQNKVWAEIERIPKGSTLTYQTLGGLIDCGSPRAVGGACGANPYPLIVPCHRVVALNGIGGFSRHNDGFYIQVKRWLLAHEGVVY